ncbi:MAG: VCBS repeat-containing protein [Planctomycetota bacterium]
MRAPALRRRLPEPSDDPPCVPARRRPLPAQSALAAGVARARPTGARRAAPAAQGAPTAPVGSGVRRWSWTDIDGDGPLDALVILDDGRGVLLRQQADGRFEDMTQAAGLAGLTWRDAAFGDFDRDGRVDLFGLAGDGQARLHLQADAGRFLPVEVDAPTRTGWMAVETIDLDRDGTWDVQLIADSERRVLRGQGDGSFVPFELGAFGELRVSSGRGASQAGAAASGGGLTTQGLAPNNTTSVPPQSQVVGGPTLVCAGSVEDIASGACLEASSVPSIGRLYPLTANLFVAGSGSVGIGTTNPNARLDVAGVARAVQFVSTVTTGQPPFLINSRNVVPLLNADQLDGLDSTAFRQLSVLLDTPDFAPQSVDTNALANGAVSAAKLAPGAIGALALSAGSVTSNAILDGTIGSADLGAGAVSGSKLQDSAVNSLKILDSSILSVDLAPGAVNSLTILDGSVTGADLAPGSVGSAAIQNGSITAADIADGSITAAELAPNAVDSSALADGAVRDADVDVNAAIQGTKVRPDFANQLVTSQLGARFGAQAGDRAELGAAGAPLRAIGSALAGVFEGRVTVASDFTGQPTLDVTHQAGATAARITLIDNTNASTDPALHVVATGDGAARGVLVETTGLGNTGSAFQVIHRGAGPGLDITSGALPLRLDRSINSGSLIEARNTNDVEFRVDSSGDVFCDGAFLGGGADYAEWLELAVPSEVVAPGEVVGVRAGRISRSLAGAERFMVVTTRPAVIGNHPDAALDAREGFAAIAFLGRTPVKVRGVCRVGDLLVPSGLDDGVAVAIAPDALRATDLSRIIGTAWDASSGAGTASIEALVGLGVERAAGLVIQRLEAALAQRDARLARLEARLEALERVR